MSQATSVTPDYLELKNTDAQIVDDYMRVVTALHTPRGVEQAVCDGQQLARVI